MYRCGLELEILFEDHGLCSEVIADFLALESAIYERRALIQPLPSASESANRQRSAHFLSDLAVSSAFHPHSSEFSLQVLDLTHVWSHSDSDVIELDDILASAVYMFIKLTLSPQQTYPRRLPRIAYCCSWLLTRQQLDDVPVLRSTSTTQRTTLSSSDSWTAGV